MITDCEKKWRSSVECQFKMAVKSWHRSDSKAIHNRSTISKNPEYNKINAFRFVECKNKSGTLQHSTSTQISVFFMTGEEMNITMIIITEPFHEIPSCQDRKTRQLWTLDRFRIGIKSDSGPTYLPEAWLKAHSNTHTKYYCRYAACLSASLPLDLICVFRSLVGCVEVNNQISQTRSLNCAWARIGNIWNKRSLRPFRW